ncbi:MAG: glycosyltransferase [Lachnospiraceae bacterium]|nr:glycosyltransferase [Lachnospiraceae bacterium]
MDKVLVVMSTYNGERYVEEQIESIMRQKDVDVTLLIRDDGSGDNTCQVIERCMATYPNIHLIKGENIGYRRSFLNTLTAEHECSYDYYAFSDQDDVWEPKKLARAVYALKRGNKPLMLYASALRVVDENLNFRYDNTFPGLRIHYGSALTRQRLAGCTMVFSPEVLTLCRQYHADPEQKNLLSHDGLVYYICLLCGGEVIFDKKSYINYRRHEDAFSRQGKSFWLKAESVLNIFTSSKNERYKQTKALADVYYDRMPADVKKTVDKVLNYRNSVHDTLALLADPQFNSGLKSVDIVNKLAILMRCY